MARSDGDGGSSTDSTDGTGAREPALVRSVDRAVTALEVVAARGEVGITELAEELVYSPLLPQVAAGVLPPTDVAEELRTGRNTR